MSDQLHTAVVELVRQAEQLGPVPLYGSPGFLELPKVNLRRVASVWRAAEVARWLRSPEAVLDDLLVDVETDRRVLTSRLVETSHDIAAAYDWDRLSRRPTHAHLQERRRGAA